MPRPLVPIALLFIAGVWCAGVLPVPFLVVWTCALLAVAASIGFADARWPLGAACFLAGTAAMRLPMDVVAPHDVRRLSGEAPQIAVVRGVLIDQPEVRETIRGDRVSERTVVGIRVSQLATNGTFVPATGTILASHRGLLSTEYFSGRHVEVEGVLQAPPSAWARGLFDYREYLGHLDVHRQLLTDQPADWKLTDAAPARIPWSLRFVPWAKETLARGLPADENTRLLWAMALGWRTALNDTVEDPFMRSGTMHIFAISGLHIALIAGMLVAVLRVARVPRAACGVASIPLIWFYVAATGWQASAIRSAVMTSVIVLGWALARPAEILNSLGAAALLVLAWQPGQLFLPGFQLSFMVVAGLALLVSPIESWLRRRLSLDPWIPDRLRPGWQRWCAGRLHELGAHGATGLAAAVVSLPLTVHYFNIVNPISLLANLIVVPISSAALASCAISLALGPVLPWFSEVFNAAAWGAMALMVWLSRWFAGVHWGSWFVPAPDWWWWIPYYGVVIGVATGWLLEPRRRASVLACGATVLAALVWTMARVATGSRIDILPECGVVDIDVPGAREDLFVNFGRTADGWLVQQWLRSRGLEKLEQAALLACDVRHAGGVEGVLEFCRPARVALPDMARRTGMLESLESEAGRLGIRLDRVGAGARVGGWEVVHPDPGAMRGRGDSGALALHGRVAGFGIMVMGPLPRASQRELVARLTNRPPVDILIAEAAGEETLLDAFLDQLRPRWVIVTCGRGSGPMRLPETARRRLTGRGHRTFFTDVDGAISLEWHGDAGWIGARRSEERVVLTRRAD